uniref:Beta-galactosidase galactose-binding domain-containing protein n=1 Tax=Romanomermis culicivorax TaxID=13658 RepID=A0A915LAN1_ROMCU
FNGWAINDATGAELTPAWKVYDLGFKKDVIDRLKSPDNRRYWRNINQVNFFNQPAFYSAKFTAPTDVTDQFVNFEVARHCIINFNSQGGRGTLRSKFTCWSFGCTLYMEVEFYILKFRTWDKGAMFVNTVNLGRYWKIGPQKALYLPAPYISQGENETWDKGAMFVNTVNLGRYWKIGPQKALYLPAPYINQGENELLLFELHKPIDWRIDFQDQPNLG